MLLNYLLSMNESITLLVEKSVDTRDGIDQVEGTKMVRWNFTGAKNQK
jgi:hypothetical protein